MVRCKLFLECIYMGLVSGFPRVDSVANEIKELIKGKK